MTDSSHFSKQFPPERWERLVSEERAEWQSVEELFRVTQPLPSEVWLDFGCGPGYFTIPLAGRVKTVFAVDVSMEMLSVCRKRVEERNLQNVRFLQSDGSQLPLGDNTIDRALLANIFHELDHPAQLLGEIQRVHKPGGKIFLLDWKPVETPTGPPLDHRIPERDVIIAVNKAGYQLEKSWDVFPYHYLLSFTKQEVETSQL